MAFLDIPGLGNVHYHEYGTGQKPMLAFHGYGMTGRQFHVLENSVLGKFKVFGFDHFFHGESKLEGWTEKQVMAGLTKTHVKAYMDAWFTIYGEQKVTLLAYSIGSNFALLLLEAFPQYIDEIILMAPDGLAGYQGFRFLQHRRLGKWLFKAITKSKWLAPALLRMVKAFGMIDDSLYTIAYNEIDTPQKRHDVYYTLNLIKYLKPDTDNLVKLINYHNIPCTLIFGRDDLLFPLKPVKPLMEQLNNVLVLEVPFGHWLVTPALDNYLVALSNDTSPQK